MQLPGSDGLPSSVEAERTILGAVLLDNAAYSEAAEQLQEDEFYLSSHQVIYRRMGAMIDAGTAVDIITLSVELENRGELESIGSRGYLFSLTENLPRRLSITDYVRIVKEKSMLRLTMGICATAQTAAGAQEETALEVLNRASSALMEVADRGLDRGFLKPSQIIRDTWDSVDGIYRGQGGAGLKTGYTDFDRMTNGLRRGELTIIGARPSMGKTALAINIAENVAIYGGGTVAVFSLEMSKSSLIQRIIASQSRVSMSRIQAGFVGRQEVLSIHEALQRIADADDRLWIDDNGSTTLAQMRAKLRRLNARAPLDLIVVDYLQLLNSTGRVENRTQEIGTFSRGMKIIAKEFNVPVVCLSQLSRATEQRGDRRPVLSDLRESGSIEQDADVVAFIHRDSYYRRGEELTDSERADSEIIIAKQRNGPTGIFHLNYLEQFTRFENPA